MEDAKVKFRRMVYRDVGYRIPAHLLAVIGDVPWIESTIQSHLAQFEEQWAIETRPTFWRMVMCYVVLKLKQFIYEQVTKELVSDKYRLTGRLREMVYEYQDAEELAERVMLEFNTAAVMIRR